MKTYAQRMLQPYTGLINIIESDHGRALTLDGKTWEFQFIHGSKKLTGLAGGANAYSYSRVASLPMAKIEKISEGDLDPGETYDERIIELAEYIASCTLPFEQEDLFECWILDREKLTPLALVFSCCTPAEKKDYPDTICWSALPSVRMPVQLTAEEEEQDIPPINYQVEKLIASRAGFNPRLHWYHRGIDRINEFPRFLISEDWDNTYEKELVRRYLDRQAPRLLMLQNIKHDDRHELEKAARKEVHEVAYFYSLYPDIVDDHLMTMVRVEAKIKDSNREKIIA